MKKYVYFINIWFFTLPISLNAWSNNAISPIETSSAPALSEPFFDAIDYFFLQPAQGIPNFLRKSADDLAEESVKFGLLYALYFQTPLKSSATKHKLALLPVAYLIANEIGDKVGDWVETLQKGESAHHYKAKTGFGHIINDVAEDLFAASCYVSRFAKGFAPTLIWSHMLARYGGPSWAASLLKVYAYYAALGKVLSDTNHCTKLSDHYGDWAEKQWDAIYESFFPGTPTGKI